MKVRPAGAVTMVAMAMTQTGVPWGFGWGLWRMPFPKIRSFACSQQRPVSNNTMGLP